MKKPKIKTYSTRAWLNPAGHSSTGSVTVFDGLNPWQRKNEKPSKFQFIEVADCHQSARLHKQPNDSMADWRFKVDTLVRELMAYKQWLDLQPD
jgi:hypothetical protein